MIVKLGSWNPNFRDENSKNIWVATTQDWVWPPPSQDYNMFMAKSLLPTCTDSTVNYNPRYTQLKHWCRGWLYWLGCDIRGPIYIYIYVYVYIYIIIYMYIYILLPYMTLMVLDHLLMKFNCLWRTRSPSVVPSTKHFESTIWQHGNDYYPHVEEESHLKIIQFPCWYIVCLTTSLPRPSFFAQV